MIREIAVAPKFKKGDFIEVTDEETRRLREKAHWANCGNVVSTDVSGLVTFSWKGHNWICHQDVMEVK